MFTNLNLGEPVNRASPLNYGLVSWWMSLPNNSGGLRLFDIAGTNHGTLTNMAPASDWVTGVNGIKALDFDGTNDEVIAASSGVIVDCSVAFWIYNRSSVSATIFYTADGASQGPRLITTGTSNQVALCLSHTNSSRMFTLPEDEFHHVVANFPTGANSVLYLDGQLATDLGPLSAARITTAGTVLGRRPAASAWFDGQLADVRLFNRMLSDGDAAAIYRDTLSGYRRTLSQKVRLGRPSTPAAPVDTDHHVHLPLLGVG